MTKEHAEANLGKNCFIWAQWITMFPKVEDPTTHHLTIKLPGGSLNGHVLRESPPIEEKFSKSLIKCLYLPLNFEFPYQFIHHHPSSQMSKHIFL